MAGRFPLVALLLAAVLAGCGGGSEGAEVSVFQIRPGDCFDDEAAGGQLSQVDVLPCARPHDNEVFAIVEDPAPPDAPFPGSEAVRDAAETRCEEPFAPYVGIAYAQSRYSIFPIVPSQATWERGDRQIICALYDHEAGKLTGSVRGSAT